jgi:outer membrane lipoprotein-sorting protein
MQGIRKKIWIALAAAMVFAGNGLFAQTTGLEIMEQVANRPGGTDMVANLTMEITNSRNSVRTRSIAQFRKDDGEVEKKIMFFTSPSDVKGTSFLSYSYADGSADSQWIYLPALKRVKRIASDNRNESFMGSDFTYDDMGTRKVSADTHSLIGEETIDSTPCYVVESIPVDKDEQYARTVSWIIKDEWIGLKKEFYLSDGTLAKRLTIDSYEKIDGIWAIAEMTMENFEKGTVTKIRMEDVSFRQTLDEKIFTERQMKIGPRT